MSQKVSAITENKKAGIMFPLMSLSPLFSKSVLHREKFVSNRNMAG